MLKRLEQLCEAKIPRKFSCAHIIMALLRLQNEPYLGRYILQEMLDLTEASVRSLLKLLKRHELIQVNPRRKGHSLSSSGDIFVQGITDTIISLRGLHLPMLVPDGKISAGFIVKAASFLVTSGIEQRDDAIRRGALGAITLIVDGSKIRFPSAESDMTNSAKSDLEELQEVVNDYTEHGDVIVLGWGNTHVEAEVGALGAAIKLVFSLLRK